MQVLVAGAWGPLAQPASQLLTQLPRPEPCSTSCSYITGPQCCSWRNCIIMCTAHSELVPSSLAALAAGWEHLLLVTVDGVCLAKGWDGHGQVGHGSRLALPPLDVPVHLQSYNKLLPMCARSTHYILTWHNPLPPAAVRIVSVAAGEQHSLALDASGSVWGWGASSNGQVGSGVVADRVPPVCVLGPIRGGSSQDTALDAPGDLARIQPCCSVSVLAAGGSMPSMLIHHPPASMKVTAFCHLAGRRCQAQLRAWQHWRCVVLGCRRSWADWSW